MMDFLFSLPLWALAVVLNVWLMGFSLASLWALRRWVLPRLHLNTNASLFYAAAVMQSVMVLYGLVAALTAVSVWSRHSQVSDIVSREATAIASVWRYLGGYSQPERDSMREALRGYTNSIINEAWPEQKLGRVPRGGVEVVDRLQAPLFVFEPKSESQKILHAETTGRLQPHDRSAAPAAGCREQRPSGRDVVRPTARRDGLPALLAVLPHRGAALPGRAGSGPGGLRRHGAVRDHQPRPAVPRRNGDTRRIRTSLSTTSS